MADRNLEVDAARQMNRLSLYLFRLLFRDTLALFGVMLVLMFLVQCLKVFDVVAVQGQDLWTLMGEALLGITPVAIVIGYVCMGIGLVRGLAALQATHELHIIHANRQLGSLFGGIAAFAGAGALALLILSNFIAPWASQRLDDWAASIAADIVGRTLTPHRFSQVVPGVTVAVGGREGTGHITDFFADDNRDPEVRRTYLAKEAVVASDGNGYVLEMQNGALQYLSRGGDFSEVSFKSYHIGLDTLTAASTIHDQWRDSNSSELVAAAVKAGTWDAETIRRLAERFADGLRVVGMCLLMTGIAGFPHARRGRNWIPYELLPLLIAYADNTIASYVSGPPGVSILAGSFVAIAAGLALLGFRLRAFRFSALRARPA